MYKYVYKTLLLEIICRHEHMQESATNLVCIEKEKSLFDKLYTDAWKRIAGNWWIQSWPQDMALSVYEVHEDGLP